MIRRARIQIANLVLGLFLTFLAGTAHAACTNPTEIEGAIVYNADQNVPQICIGSSWIAIGALNPAAGGGACTNPADTEGAIVYNDDFDVLQYCDGDVWRAVAASGGGTLTPLDHPSGLFGWWSTENAGDITLNGSNVSGVTDRSGNGNDLTQSTSSDQPLWTAGGWPGGHNQITFDGLNDYLPSTPNTVNVTGEFTGIVTVNSNVTVEIDPVLFGSAGLEWGLYLWISGSDAEVGVVDWNGSIPTSNYAATNLDFSLMPFPAVVAFWRDSTNAIHISINNQEQVLIGHDDMSATPGNGPVGWGVSVDGDAVSTTDLAFWTEYIGDADRQAIIQGFMDRLGITF